VRANFRGLKLILWCFEPSAKIWGFQVCEQNCLAPGVCAYNSGLLEIARTLGASSSRTMSGAWCLHKNSWRMECLTALAMFNGLGVCEQNSEPMEVVREISWLLKLVHTISWSLEFVRKISGP